MKRVVLAPVLLLVGISIFATPLAFGAVTPTPTPVSKNPYGAGSVDPAGPNEIILTIANGKKSQDFTMKNLMAMHPSVISIFEPFVKKRQKFSVIPLATLFRKLSIPSSARVVTKALNEYVYTNTAAGFIAAKGYLAVKLNGANIPYDQGGPIRIIFPDDSIWSKLADPWNWSMRSITVKN